MSNNELKERLLAAESLDQAKEILKDRSDIDAERAWQEIENRHAAKAEKLDLEELDAVSGGADRDWRRNGCAATCEWDSWCWSNDRCIVWDVTYDSFWTTYPDGHEHVYKKKPCLRPLRL